MSLGSLKTLFVMLSEAPTLQGVSVVFGEEMIAAEDQPLPMVVIVPGAGVYHEPGYFRNSDPNLQIVWGLNETIDLYLWAHSEDEEAQQPIDHADAIENLRAQVLQAFQTQRPLGLFYKPTTGHWEKMENAVSRYGRAYVLSVQVEIAIPDVLPPEATIRSVEVDPDPAE